MYVKIRKDGAIGLGRGTEGQAEIAIGYGEAHMIAAALEKLAQTARNYKQTYKKTTDVGAGNKIEFERAEEGTITIKGDGQAYVCSESEIKELAIQLKSLPPIELTPSSDYAEKMTPQGDLCVRVKNNNNSVALSLPEAALLKTAILSSIDGKYYQEEMVLGKRTITVNRTSDLKWELIVNGNAIKFTAYEVESLVAGLHNAILEVLMNLVKSLGSDDIADIRIKSHIQRMEQDTLKVMEEHKKVKAIARELVGRTKKILATKNDADTRTNEFIQMCQFVFARFNPKFYEQLFNLFSSIFVTPA